MDYITNYNRWLNSSKVSKEDKLILLSMSKEEKADAFYKDAEFGTGGMRGILGPGTNRLNEHTITRVAIAFGLFVKKTYENAENRGVAISHDNRHHSRDFTLLSARILNQMGINTYIFDSLRPTPELSFAVRELGCCGGIMVTASHNPKQYNGYKVYDDTGCQLVPDSIQPMLDILSSLPNELDIEVPSSSKKGINQIISPELDEKYCSLVLSCQVHPELDKNGFKVIYSPQHGASLESALKVFESAGYEIIPVKEQCVHDPDFGATKSPNPEVASAWELSLEYAKRNHADLCVMTDPDGDRCGLAYLSSKGNYERLTGNQSGALLIDYLFKSYLEKGIMPENPVMYDTIVTSDLGRSIATSYGVKVESFLTGFKYIGERIHHYEKIGHGPTFVFGYEESYGCLVKPFVRDKDGVQAILLYSEMALYYKRKGIALDEAFKNLEEKYGYHHACLNDAYFEGMEGNDTMKRLMKELHESPLTSLAGLKVKSIEDYLHDVITFDDGTTKKIEGLPVSDVLKYRFEDGSTLAIRPSGTEPKVKFYIETKGKTSEGLDIKAKSIYAGIMNRLGLE
ncbi:MAG TPA: phosphoglucomutase, partial [Firmicutes bacterium]|nr:phosphoglucomutase [Bacillota bacterium]